MSKKRIVTTARGLKLDFDALKSSRPAKTIIVGKGKEKSVKNTIKNVSLRTNPRINATIPAKRPKPIMTPVAKPEGTVLKPVELKKVEPSVVIAKSTHTTAKPTENKLGGKTLEIIEDAQKQNKNKE